MATSKYVVKHGSIKTGDNQHLHPSADPHRPTVIELDDVEAFRMGGDGSLQRLSEYEAELKAGTLTKKPNPHPNYVQERAKREGEWDPARAAYDADRAATAARAPGRQPAPGASHAAAPTSRLAKEQQ